MLWLLLVALAGFLEFLCGFGACFVSCGVILARRRVQLIWVMWLVLGLALMAHGAAVFGDTI